MPRRIRLVFETNAGGDVCPIAGYSDAVIVRAFRTRPYGVCYDASFEHDLSPYYRANGKGDWLPVHPQPSGLLYKNWPALAGAATEEERPAQIVALAERRLRASGAPREARVLASGFDMDNMKARSFVETAMPFFLLPERLPKQVTRAFHHTARGLVAASDLAGIAEIAGDPAPLQQRVNESWLKILRKEAIGLFEETVRFDALPLRIMERVVPARRRLMMNFSGFGAMGSKLFAALNLPTPVSKEVAA